MLKIKITITMFKRTLFRTFSPIVRRSITDVTKNFPPNLMELVCLREKEIEKEQQKIDDVYLKYVDFAKKKNMALLGSYLLNFTKCLCGKPINHGWAAYLTTDYYEDFRNYRGIRTYVDEHESRIRDTIHYTDKTLKLDNFFPSDEEINRIVNYFNGQGFACYHEREYRNGEKSEFCNEKHLTLRISACQCQNNKKNIVIKSALTN